MHVAGKSSVQETAKVPGVFIGKIRLAEPTKGNKQHPGMIHLVMDGPGLSKAAERSLNRLLIKGVGKGSIHCDGTEIHVVAERPTGGKPLSLRHLRTLGERVFRAIEQWSRDNQDNIFVFTACICTPDEAIAVNSDWNPSGSSSSERGDLVY